MGDRDNPVDRALLDLDASWNEEVDARPAAEPSRGDNDRTIAGLGIGTPHSMPVAAAPRATPASAATPIAVRSPLAQPHEPQPELVHPEQSPLSFVMRASESSAVRQKEASHEMSMFVAGLVADSSPVIEAAPAGAAMEPVMRRSRKRRHWLIASAIAATAIAGTALGIHFAASESSPKIAASATGPEPPPPTAIEPTGQPPAVADTPTAPTLEAPTAPTAVAEAVPPSAESPPQASAVAPPHAEADLPTATAVVATSDTTAKTRSAAKVTTKPTTKKAVPKKVATAKTTAKQSAKKPSPTKQAIAKKATAKKPTIAKKTTKPATAKKPRK